MKSIFKKIDELKSKIDEFRPIASDLVGLIRERLELEWIYNSNAIEGNTLTFGETLFFLKEGITSEGKPLKDYLEAKNHAQAIDGLYEIIRNERTLTESVIKQLHAVLLKDIEFTYTKGARGQIVKKPVNPGKYKTRPNHVLTASGRIHRYTDPVHVTDEMEHLINKLSHSGKMHPVEKAADFHYRFVAIHPFDDGNGRMARLLMNLLLLKNGYPPCIIRNKNRRAYLKVLEKADRGDLNSFIMFIARELLDTETEMLNILYGNEAVLVVGDTNSSILKDERLELILNVVSKKPISIGQIHAKLPEIKRPTLKKDLAELVDLGKIKRQGKGKGTVYYR